MSRQSKQPSRASRDSARGHAIAGRGAEPKPSHPVKAFCSAPVKHPPRDNRPKLTIDDARAIRKRREQGETLQSLADAFGVVLGTIDHICRGRTFKSLGGRVVVRVTRPRGPNRWGKRYSKCCRCAAPIPVAGLATRGFCDKCTQLGCATFTVYDREKSIGAIPINLVKRYLSG